MLGSAASRAEEGERCGHSSAAAARSEDNDFGWRTIGVRSGLLEQKHEFLNMGANVPDEYQPLPSER